MRLRLSREVRFGLTGVEASGEAGRNTWAGWPGGDEAGGFVTVRVSVSGAVDGRTGLICNIKRLDELVRRSVVPALVSLQARRRAGAGRLVVCAWGVLRSGALPDGVRLERVELVVSPYLSFGVVRGDSEMVLMSYEFEFSAAHRLYCPSMSDGENARLFGRCTNANGHGHNYVVRVTLRGPVDAETGVVFPADRFAQIVNERVIDRFDHQHLNLDCAEFSARNPTVENITQVVFDLLKGRFGSAEVRRVRVYETPKTFAECAVEDG